jgi:hypothetical protein
MAGWTAARPSIEKKLKALGFTDEQLKGIWAHSPSDRKALTEQVDKLIKAKKDKETAVKKAVKESFPWF